MSTKSKIYCSLLIWIASTFIYYLAFVSSKKWLIDFCNKKYCIEFLPYGDFLAAYIAIVGLYFVVTSLDAWKEQHLFNNAIENLTRLTVFEKEIQQFNVEFARLNEENSSNQRKLNLYQNFHRYLDTSKIEDNLKELELHTIDTSENLYQEKFESIVNHARQSIINPIEDFEKLAWHNIQNEHKTSDAGAIHTNFSNHFSLYSSELVELKKLLNKKLKP